MAEIEKVIEDLESIKRTLYNLTGSHKNERKVDNAIRTIRELQSKSEEVCEWKKGSSGYIGYPAYYSKCCTTNSNGLEMQTHIISDWKYCPYCGRKIKVVE